MKVKRLIAVLLFFALMPRAYAANAAGQERVSDQIEQEEILASRARRIVRYMAGSEDVDVMVSLEIRKRTRAVEIGGRTDIIRIPGFEIVKADVIVFIDSSIKMDESLNKEIMEILPKYLHLKSMEVDIRQVKLKSDKGRVTLGRLFSFPYVYGTTGIGLMLIIFLIAGGFGQTLNNNMAGFLTAAQNFVDSFRKSSMGFGAGGNNAVMPGAVSAAEVSGAKQAGEKNGTEKPFSFITEDDIDNLLLLFQKEKNPQLIAVVLNYVEASLGSKIFAFLDRKIQEQIISYLSEAKELDMEKVLSMHSKVKDGLAYLLGGESKIRQLIDYSGEDQKKNILEIIGEGDKSLAEKIGKSLITFENILALPAKDMLKVFGPLKQDEFIGLLVSLDENIRDRILAAYPEIAANSLKEMMEYASPLTRKVLEQVKVTVVNLARRLDYEGVIELTGRS